jgi:alpha-tubulin suppressor-like RCC1 family protein
MPALLRPAAAVVALTLLSFGSVTSRAQVSGDATISATVLNQPLSISTRTQYGGAVSSIHWAGKEFINNWDHGRQLSPNYQFFNRFICYNPYETGSLEDGNKPTSTSKVLSLSVSGNTVQTETQMAWYYSTFVDAAHAKPEDYCGDPSKWLPVTPYQTQLSNYKVRKTATIGYAGIPNVIEYLTEVYIPEPVLKGINNPTAVLNYDFSAVQSYDVVSKDYRKVRASGGEDDRIKVVSTPDGNYAMGWYSPELLQPYDGVGSVNWWFVVPPNPFYTDPNNPSQPDPNFACVHVGSIHRYDSFGGSGWYPQDRAYLVIGNLAQVKTGLNDVHLKFGSLDPEVFNWRDYLAINGLESTISTPEAARDHWLTQGIGQGLRGAKTFSASQYLQLNPDLANMFGSQNYQSAIDHYVGSGRGEGRSTVAKPAAGMQHLLVFANKGVNASGQGAFGQLGTSSPPHISSLDNSVTEIVAGDYTSFAVKNDGTLWVWGSNQYGARGDGSSGGNIATPVQVPLPFKVSTPSRHGRHAVAAGLGVYAALDTEGQVWTWGVNWNGRLGDGTTTTHFTPARVLKNANPGDYLTGIVTIAAGGGTLAAVDSDASVWTWGAGANGARGDGSTNDSSFPTLVVQADGQNASTPLSGVNEVACGSSGFCIALNRSGAVFGWGNNSFSQLGIAPGGSSSIAIPIPIPSGSPIDAIAAGSAHGIAQSKDGNVFGWGYNGRGQLGNGSIGVAQAPPVAMSSGPDGMDNIGEVVAGPNFSVMVRYTDRAVFVTGDNQSGQLAIPGNPSIQKLPVRSSF